jgi:hypothetical protein
MLAALLLALNAVGTTPGFEAPESAFWDEGSRSWYVSNIVGTPLEKDGKGWISRLDADGKVVKLRWVEGLDAPKGIRVKGGTLYVSDIDTMVVIDIKEAKVKARLKCEGAVFLNDTAVGKNGDVFVSDTMTHAIYRCVGDKQCEVFLKDQRLESPNGLLVDGERLVVAAWGTITDPSTFATKTPGHLMTVDLKTKEIRPIGDGKPIGNLDGLEKDGEDYLVTDWVAGKLMRVTKTGAVMVLKDGFKNSADIGYDPKRHLLAVPEMGTGTVQLFKLAQ